jgi:DNA-binding transcriptional LysR family regulator
MVLGSGGVGKGGAIRRPGKRTPRGGTVRDRGRAGLALAPGIRRNRRRDKGLRRLRHRSRKLARAVRCISGPRPPRHTPTMNLRQLEVFQAVMQTGNMTAAGRLVCITPSAVSKIIAHAELQLGYPLFTRTKGTLVPTPEAAVLFAESEAIHGKLAQLRRIAANLRQTDGGQVRLAASPALSHELLPTVLAQHAQRHREVQVEVHTLHREQMPQALLARAVDFALGHDEHPHPQIVSRELGRGPLYVAATRELWQRAQRARRGDPLPFLAGVPMIQPLPGDPLRAACDQLAAQLGLEGTPRLQVQTVRLALELVRRGLGWTVIDCVTAENPAAQGASALELHPLHTLPETVVYAYHAHAAPPGRAVLRMLELVRAQLQHNTRARAPAVALAA